MHRMAGCRAQAGRSLSRESSGSDFMESPSPSASSPMPKMNLHLGVLHYTPLRRARLLDPPTCLCLYLCVDAYSLQIKTDVQPRRCAALVRTGLIMEVTSSEVLVTQWYR